MDNAIETAHVIALKGHHVLICDNLHVLMN